MYQKCKHLVQPLLGCFLFAIGVFCCTAAIAQQKKITGNITDKRTGKPIAGASIREKNVKTGTASDTSGFFALTLQSPNAVLLVSSLGYRNFEINTAGRTTLTIELAEADATSMSDVVVIGYQSVSRRTTTAAVGTVKGKDIENIPYATFDQMLQGRVAGLSSLAISGEPGARNNVVIRGTNSVSLGEVKSPLYVIDGMVFDINDKPGAYSSNNPLSAINPNDIESIDVLKDASASAIYGARGANGVILVKTKNSRIGKPEYQLSAYMGVADRPALKPVIVGAAERRLKMDLLYNGGDYTAIAGGQLSPFLTDSLNPAFNNNTDWQGLFLRSARVTNVDAGIAAADSKFAYRLSFNHYTEQGVMKGYDFKRAQPHLYLSANPGRGLNVTANLFIGMIRQAHGSGDGNRYPFSTWSFPSSFWKLTPDLISAYTGGFASQMDDDRSTSLNANIRLTDTLAKGLLLTSSFSSNNDFNNRDWFYSKLVNPNGTNDVLSFNYKTSRWEVENYLTYNTSIAEDHHLSAVLGQGAENQKNGYTNSEADGVNVGHVVTISNVPPGTNLFTTSYREERSRLSWFGRLAYDFKGRYLFSGSYRRDASSRYSSDNRWANFYSASAGWIVSDEPFFQGIKNVVSFFKLRGSYGVTGSDPSNYYAQYQKLVANAAYNGSSLSGGANQGLHVLGWDIPGFGMSTYNGTTALVPDYASAAAKNASWEKYPQFNIGVDMSFLKDRISLTADVYVRDSKNLFFYNVKPQVTSGYNYFTGNMVDLRNRGVEFTLNTNNLSPTSKFKWSTNFNIALNDNFVTKLPNGNRDFVFGDPWLQQTLTIGQPVFTYSVWETNGVFSTNAEVPVDPLTGKRLTMFGGNVYSAGDPKRVDQNGDYNIDYLDKISYGNPNPRVTGGIVNQFSYKGFSLQVLCSFITGRKIWNGYLSDKFNGSSYNAYGVWGTQSGPASNLNGLSFWQKPGDVAQYPGMIGNNVDKWHISNSTFIEDGSFFKLRQVMAGYTLPQAITKKLKLKNIRIYGMADNLIILSRATIPDPEAVSPTGWSSGSDYPVPKKYTFGIEVQL